MRNGNFSFIEILFLVAMFILAFKCIGIDSIANRFNSKGKIITFVVEEKRSGYYDY